MNKQQIINHIAVKLDALVNGVQPADWTVQIGLLSTILREITRDDDYFYSQPGNIYSGSTTTLNETTLRNGISSLRGNDSPTIAHNG